MDRYKAARARKRKLAQPCPTCDAAPQSLCVNADDTPRPGFHRDRGKAATRARAVDLGTDHYGRAHRVTAGPAAHGTECPRCDEIMHTVADMVRHDRYGWIHRACAPGSDDR